MLKKLYIVLLVLLVPALAIAAIVAIASTLQESPPLTTKVDHRLSANWFAKKP